MKLQFLHGILEVIDVELEINFLERLTATTERELFFSFLLKCHHFGVGSLKIE